MRRSLEWAGLVSRFLSMLWIIGSFALLTPPQATYAAHAWLVGLSLAALPGLANVLAVYALRNVAHRHYPKMSAALIVADTAAVIMMISTAGESRSRIWPLFLIPIIVAAYRHQMLGACLTAAATATSGLLMYALSPEPGNDALLTFAPALEFLVALMTGLLSHAHRQHLRQLAQARSELRRQALHDALTGLPNRNQLNAYAQDALRPGRTVSVLLMDLDGFKAVNDNLGHAAGDDLLRIVADRLRAHVRAEDLIVRLGGDEFVVMLCDTDEATAAKVAARLRTALTAPVSRNERAIDFDVSVGIATADGASLDELLHEADAQMYRVKSAHRVARPALSSR